MYNIEFLNLGYFVDHVFIEWSTTYEDVAEILKGRDLKESPYRGNPNFQCLSPNLLGIKTVLFHANGLPSKNKPILNVSYDLPINDSDDIDPNQWLHPLMKLLGSPDRIEKRQTNS